MYYTGYTDIFHVLLTLCGPYFIYFIGKVCTYVCCLCISFKNNWGIDKYTYVYDGVLSTVTLRCFRYKNIAAVFCLLNSTGRCGFHDGIKISYWRLRHTFQNLCYRMYNSWEQFMAVIIKQVLRGIVMYMRTHLHPRDSSVFFVVNY